MKAGSRSLLFSVFLFAFSTAHATPLGLEFGTSNVPQLRLLPLAENTGKSASDTETLAQNQLITGPLNIGISRPHDIDMTLGKWRAINNGHVWQLMIQSPNAAAIGVHFDQFNLAEEDQLWLYNPNGETVYGPYNQSQANQFGEFWAPAVEGDRIVIELQQQAAPNKQKLHVAAVNHSHTEWWKSDASLAVEPAGACNIDAVCIVNGNQTDKVRSTVAITFTDDEPDGEGNIQYGLCSASLINNTQGDGKPLLLTAHHCLDSDTEAASVNSYWLYQASCCGSSDTGLGPAIGNAQLLATWDVTDFTLLELDNSPTDSLLPYWAGWDRTQDSLFSAIGVHHPQGDVKKISYRNDGVQIRSGLDDGRVLRPDANYVVVSAWSLGTTERGSSGSGLWNSANKLIGQLRGGNAFCENTDGSDYYGWLGQSWDGGGSPSNRLRDWLDPTNSDVNTLEGYDHINDTQAAGDLHCGTASLPSGGYGGGLGGGSGLWFVIASLAFGLFRFLPMPITALLFARRRNSR